MDEFLIISGCTPFVPNVPGRPCGGCNGATAKLKQPAYCLRCDAVSPSLARMIAARAARETDAVAKAESREAERKAKRELADRFPDGLTERERRHVAAGKRRMEGVANPSKVGREWLSERGQKPDWSVALDRKGRPIVPV